ncbi:MAG: hypothetical protein GKR89_31700 [Candidatus Latescibacteria bacterium]|nr:hypothetical protein [Candidatus Latescibacterota bacterium]
MLFRILIAMLVLAAANVWGQEKDTPIVRGGIGDKPFIKGTGGRTFLGGYTEAHFRYEREEGITEELTFDPKRFNLFTYTPVSDRVRVASELEFEEGGEEIKIEIAVLDFEIHPAITFRGGIILSPLGRFNLSHDSPTNDLTDRPLVSTEIIPTALSEGGMGFYGSIHPSAQGRITYEVYAVNGFNEGVVGGEAEGTRIAAGRGNFEDNNNRPAWVGRLGLSPRPNVEVGVSLHTGAYNVWEADGLAVDEKRSLTIFALDWEARRGPFELLGEYASAAIDVPEESAIFQSSQQGYYIQANGHFGQGWIGQLPKGHFTGVVRYGTVDFDADIDGDSHRRLTVGINFRPEEEAVFKVDYQRNWHRDAFDNPARGAAFLFSAATYF